MATATNSATNNAAQMLKNDHQRVKEMFREFEGLSDTAYKTKQRLVEKVCLELEVHSKLEEEVFYPAARAVAEEEIGEVVSEGLEEHHVVDILITELRGMDPEDEQYDAKFKVLMENVEHHIEEEEEELLPEAERALSGQMESLAEEMHVLKQQLVGSQA